MRSYVTNASDIARTAYLITVSIILQGHSSLYACAVVNIFGEAPALVTVWQLTESDKLPAVNHVLI